MKIGFTGHQDRSCNPAVLEDIAAEFPGAPWYHGGAKGFDTQVDEFARARSIPVVALKPDYKKHKDVHPKAVPLIRDRELVDQVDLLVACYDGRTKGGTFYTVNYAKKKQVRTRFVTPLTTRP